MPATERYLLDLSPESALQMSATSLKTLILLPALLLSLGAALSAAAPPSVGSGTWYPADITPPPGHPLFVRPHRPARRPPRHPRRGSPVHRPRLLHGPQGDPGELILLAATEKSQTGLEPRLADYLRTTDEALRKIQGEPVPAGPAPFAGNVTNAIELQRAFFRKAVAARGRGTPIRRSSAFPKPSRPRASCWEPGRRRPIVITAPGARKPRTASITTSARWTSSDAPRSTGLDGCALKIKPLRALQGYRVPLAPKRDSRARLPICPFQTQCSRGPKNQ